AVRLRHVDAEQPEGRAAQDEIARERPVLLLELFELRQHFRVDELLRGPADEAVLVGEPFRREHAVGARRLEQPLAAAKNRRLSCYRHSQTLSKIPAAPIPPPTHIVTMP